MSDTETTTEETTANPRSQMFKHRAMVEWLTSTKGMPADADQATVISFAFAYRVEWRRSDTYRNLVQEYNASAEAREKEAAAAREAAKAQKAQEREAAKAAKEAAKAAAAEPQKAEKAEGDAPAKATSKKGKGAKEGTPTEENPFA
jgi:hypothetical protein